MIALTGPTVEGGEPEMSEYLNLQGLPLWSTDPADRKTNFSYSNFGQTVTTHYVNPVTGTPLSGITDVVEYDSVGNLVRVTDTLGRVTDYEYDELHRLTRMILPDADLQDALSRPDVSYKYDTFGNLREVTDAKGYVTSYFYDNLDRLIRVEQPRPHDFEDVPVTEFAYNRAGEMVSATDALGNTTTYDYDFLGRMIRVEMPDPDGAGSLTAPVMIYAYDAAGQVETETSTDLGRSAGSPDSL
jgi:YD repeat-containing protein